MIIEAFDKNSHFATQAIKYRTILHNKFYYWMQDTDGTWYLLHEDEEGNPTFA